MFVISVSVVLQQIGSNVVELENLVFLSDEEIRAPLVGLAKMCVMVSFSFRMSQESLSSGVMDGT